MAEYKSSNSGILSTDMVKTGDKLIIITEATPKFVEATQKTYWNVQVQLPDGSRKLASPFDSALDQFSAKWGSNTEKWIGRTVLVEIKTGKNSGKPYISLAPSDDAVVDVSNLDAERATATEASVPLPPEPGESDKNDLPY